MKAYKMVRYCRLCKKRFVVMHHRYPSFYCDECSKKYRNESSEESDD